MLCTYLFSNLIPPPPPPPPPLTRKMYTLRSVIINKNETSRENIKESNSSKKKTALERDPLPRP